MIRVEVTRAPADRPGPEITDQLIETEAAAVARGAAEIDYNCSARLSVDGAMPIRSYIAPRDLVEVTDNEAGSYLAMVEGFSITIDRSRDGLTAQASIRLERVA